MFYYRYIYISNPIRIETIELDFAVVCLNLQKINTREFHISKNFLEGEDEVELENKNESVQDSTFFRFCLSKFGQQFDFFTRILVFKYCEIVLKKRLFIYTYAINLLDPMKHKNIQQYSYVVSWPAPNIQNSLVFLVIPSLDWWVKRKFDWDCSYDHG